jgi:hypothetical protein
MGSGSGSGPSGIKPNYNVSLKSSSGNAIKMGVAAAAVSAYLRSQSKRDQDQSPSERLRNGISRPASAPNYYSHDRSDGFLEPSAYNLVLSPVYFWLPFNIWHPASRPTSTNSALVDSSSSSDRSVWSDNHYEEGEIGSWKINGLPESVQASLRLMHTKQKSAFPMDQAIETQSISNDDFDATMKEYQRLYAAGEELDRQRSVELEAIVAQTQIDKAQGEENAATTNLEISKKRMDEKSKQAEATYLQENAAEKAQDKARATRWICDGYFSWVRNCTPNEDQALSTAIEKRMAAQGEAELESRFAFQAERDKTQADENLARMHNAMVEFPNPSRAHVTEIENQKQALQAQSAALNGKIDKMSGFLRFVSHGAHFNSAICSNPYIYKPVAGSQKLQHPFFSESVEAELVPQDEVEIVVCLTDGQKLESVHILGANDKEIANSKIQRDDSGRIEGISIFDEDGKRVEDLRWVSLANGKTRFAMTFVNEESKEVSIYTEFMER